MIQELYNRQIGTQQALEQVRNEIQYTEVVADVIGKNLGIDLEKLVAERQRLLNIQKIREIATAQEEQKKITEKTE
jgi:predicted TIM-barrel enzyme